MSWVGDTTGEPSAAESRFWVESISSFASRWAEVESGTWTAIWSPSKSALKAKQTSGWIWIADPSTSTGMNAWIPSRCRVGARLSSTGMVLDHLFEDVPDLRPHPLDDALGALDVVREALLDELAHDERLEQLERHLLGKAALVQLQLRADHDHRAAGVVDALAEQVLAEAPLLALEHVRQALEPMVAGSRDGPPAAAVVDQRVARLLQHPLLVADDDLGRLQVEEAAEPVVAVDHAPVQVVQVAGCEAAAVELHHRAQVGRDDRQGREDHPLGPGAALAEGLDQAQALDRLLATLAGGLAHLDVQPLGQLVQVELLDDLLDRLGAHAGVEEASVLLGERAELGLGQGLHDLDVGDLGSRGTRRQLRVIGLAGHLGLLGRQCVVDAAAEVGDGGLETLGRVRLCLLDLLLQRLDLGLDGLAQGDEGALGRLTGLGHHLAGGGEDDVLGDASCRPP